MQHTQYQVNVCSRLRALNEQIEAQSPTLEQLREKCILFVKGHLTLGYFKLHSTKTFRTKQQNLQHLEIFNREFKVLNEQEEIGS